MSKYVNDENLQIAMTEYEHLEKNRIAWRPDGEALGTVSQVYDNEYGSGEQVYAVILLIRPSYVIL